MDRQRTVGAGQRMASLAVLALLCALSVWLLAARTQLNPAVVVALTAPAPKAGAAGTSASGAPQMSPEGGEGGEAGGAAAQSAKAPAGLASLLPDAVAGQNGPKALAPAESFSPATLSDKIDGKAELYLAAGFAAMACRGYSAGGARIDAYLYRMKSPDAAFAVFSGQRRPGAAQSPLAKNAYLTDNALFLTSGRDYLELIADRAGARAALEGLAKAVLAALAPEAGAAGAKAEVQPQELFPRAGLKADSIRLAVADAFGCQGLTGVYTAEYESAPAAFLSRRKDAAEAASQARLYQKFLTDNGYAQQAAPGAPAGAPAGALVLAMEGSVEILFTRGPLLAGVHDAPDLAAALRQAAALDASLKAKGVK